MSVSLCADFERTVTTAYPRVTGNESDIPATLSLDRLGRAIVVDGTWVRLTRTEFRIMDRLLRTRSEVVLWDVLIDWVYGDAEDGGPENARRTLRVMVHKLKHRVLGMGLPWPVRSRPCWGLYVEYGS